MKKTIFFLAGGAMIALIVILSIPAARDSVLEFGQQYGYLSMLVVSFFGGISLLIPLPYPILVISLTDAGLNPLLLSLLAGLGATAGDGVSYYLGYSGSEAFPEKVARFRDWVIAKSEKYKYSSALILFLWAALIPLPNEILVIPLGIAKHGVWRTLAVTGAGNVVFVLLFAYGTRLFA